MFDRCSLIMRTILIAVAAMMSMSPALAAPNANEQACILKVADTLPKIAGMNIGKSRTTPMPLPAGWPGSGPPLRVEIDWSAAGQTATWAYLCAVSLNGVIVQRLAQ
ncbi:hypothetical protein [Bradyrhizobium sp. McL0616]|uniref:hypothetical protein n=1 Tax=Bradyrhizobium sp. McL0616 TaxID=3415674 RepID=UPI003CF6E6E2